MRTARRASASLFVTYLAPLRVDDVGQEGKVQHHGRRLRPGDQRTTQVLGVSCHVSEVVEARE